MTPHPSQYLRVRARGGIREGEGVQNGDRRARHVRVEGVAEGLRHILEGR